MQIRRTTGFIVLSLFTAFFLAACGGGGGGASAVPVPEVTTAGASSITVNSAVLNGTVNPTGLATTYWFEWGTGSTLATYDNTSSKSAGSGTAGVAASDSITGLSQGTTYYYRLAASNSAGTTKGLIVSLTTASPLDPPTVQTLAADTITISGATLKATVIPNGLATDAYFEWGIDNTFAVPNVTSPQSVGTDNTSHQVNAVLTGLTTGTKYYYRVVATNSAGTSRGLTASFTTNTQAPTVVTDPASPVGTDNALLKGTVNPNGLATTYHFEWGTSSTLATYDNTPTVSAGSGTGNVAVSAAISSLSEATIYYFRVVATNSTGTEQGTIRFLTTLQNPPPTAVAHFNESVFMAGPNGSSVGAYGPTTVTLLGSDSTDAFGTITSYLWTQIGGTNTPAISDPAADNTDFPAPALAYGTNDNLVFQLTVTDNRGLSGTDNIWKNIKWGYLDDFSADTTGTYVVFDTLDPGATLTYDSSGQRAQVTTGDNTGLIFSKFLPVNNTGVFSLDFNPTSSFGSGGSISIRLADASDTYYEFSTEEAMIKKVRAGIVVDNTAFPFAYSQDATYPIKITYSRYLVRVEAFGQDVSLVTEGPGHDESVNAVNYFEVETTQQNAKYDNLQLEAAP
jgi:hypothetical protein